MTYTELSEALDHLSVDAMLIKTQADALVLGQALRDLSSQADALAERLPESV